MSKAPRRKKKRAIIALDLKDRTKLAALLNDPVMQAALSNIELLKPSVFFPGTGIFAHEAKDPAMATLTASNRLHQIQGWESFEIALFAQTEDPKTAREKLTETFTTEV